MASIHRQKGRPSWFCAFTIYQKDGGAKREFRSTETPHKKQAQQVCETWQRAALKARNRSLTADSARGVIARGVSDVLLASGAESLPRATVRAWCETWLEAKSIESEPSTHARYKRIIERFVEFIGTKSRDLSTLQAPDITRFRDREAKELSRATANLSLKVLRVCFAEALRQDLLEVNPAVRVKVLTTTDKSAPARFLHTGSETHPESLR